MDRDGRTHSFLLLTFKIKTKYGVIGHQTTSSLPEQKNGKKKILPSGNQTTTMSCAAAPQKSYLKYL